jgi:hypothetical protein
MSIKRNTRRVDLQGLFRWKKELQVKNDKDEVAATVYQRVVNDADFEKARLAAIRRSRQTRLALRDTNSDEYAALMESLIRYSNDQKINIIMAEKFPDMYEHARNNVELKLPKHPGSGASLEELEEYENSLDEYNEKAATELQKAVNKLAEKEKERLSKFSDDELSSLCAKSLENQICQNMLSVHFDEQLAYLGTYSDSEYKERMFNTFSEFDELAAQVKEQLIRGYKQLTVSSEELKN